MVTLVTVVLPGARGVRAKKKLLELAYTESYLLLINYYMKKCLVQKRRKA